MEGYICKIASCSKQLKAAERIKIKDLSNAIALDNAVTDDTPLLITPDFYAELDVHNEKSKDKDYKKYVIVDVAGNKYTTGSESFWSAFKGIADEMAEAVEAGEDAEGYSVEVYRLPSKNYQGKSFLTCSLA